MARIPAEVMSTADGVNRGAVLATLLVAVAVTAVALAVATPWGALPHAVVAAARPDADFTAAEISRATAYRGPVRLLSVAGLLVSTAVALVLGLTPWGARLVGWIGGGSNLRATLLGVPLLLLIGRLAVLPFGLRAESLARGVGLSTRNGAGYAADWSKSFLLEAVLATAAFAFLLWLIGRLPARWPWVAASIAAVAVVVIAALVPLVVEPLFNRFEPLPDGPLRTQLLATAESAGVPVRDVLVADASRRTSAHNAYVSGIGPTRRIVVYDTLLKDAPPDQVAAVVAHELGHAARRDVLTAAVLGAAGAFCAVLLLGLVLTSDALLSRAGVPAPNDPRAAGLVLAVLAVAGLVVGPVAALSSRYVEARADVFALDLTRDPALQVAMQRDLALANLADPDPPRWAVWWWGTHPTTAERAELARHWAREHGVAVPGPTVGAAR